MSKWNGEVEVLPGAGLQEVARGAFRRDGKIGLEEGLADSPLRWRTMIHELIHSHSAGGAQFDYEAAKGWEEGVVEHLQRLIRPDVLLAIGEIVDEQAILNYESGWRFDPYLPAWEAIRNALGEVDQEQFYAELLPVKIKDRHAFVQGQAVRAGNLQAIRIISETKGRLDIDLLKVRNHG
jgi:hypothetical protein